jgi:hypothetical protein
VIREGNLSPQIRIDIEKPPTIHNWDYSFSYLEKNWTLDNWKKVYSFLYNRDHISQETPLKIGKYEEAALLITRPLFFRLVIPFLLMFSVILICLLIFISNFGDYLTASLAILFGIFSLRQILIPSELIGVRTILDLVIIILYLMYFLSSGAFFVLHFSKEKNSTSIPKKNTISISPENSRSTGTKESLSLLKYSVIALLFLLVGRIVHKVFDREKKR